MILATLKAALVRAFRFGASSSALETNVTRLFEIGGLRFGEVVALQVLVSVLIARDLERSEDAESAHAALKSRTLAALAGAQFAAAQPDAAAKYRRIAELMVEGIFDGLTAAPRTSAPQRTVAAHQAARRMRSGRRFPARPTRRSR